ncbi:Uncharacterized protein TCAP_00384 [Tolypocladium capitatum]|uniref:Zn(2)-C6 fungal-type domain-containing protein n=1 Tax=Tolypocladium capitatum TaxID=45235 RepID=A0A2K3QQ97_9HYPO|nr:Uncharacterized protein TCAP_00384 [Tolypocladium capitatum]
MSVPAKPHNVCAGCRSRKKKCDGGRPSCSSCARRGYQCFYAPSGPDLSGAVGDIGWLPTLHDPQGWDLLGENTSGLFGLEPDPGGPNLLQWPNMPGEQQWTPPVAEALRDGSLDFASSDSYGLPTPQNSASPRDGKPRDDEVSLPPLPRLLELIDIYFETLYPYLPVIHKSSFLNSIKAKGVYQDSSVLLFAICAVSAGAHPDRQLQQRQAEWLTEAKAQLSQSMHSPRHALQTLQAAILVMYQAIIETDFSTSWLMLGEAWRKAVAIGYSQSDGPARLTMPALGSSPGDGWIEREESRRVVWMLFIFDRGLCFPVGLTHAVDDRQLRVNLPMADHYFQAADPEEDPLSEPMPRFALDMDQLISAVQAQYRRSSGNILQCLVLAYMLLGRIGEVLYSPDFDYGQQDHLLDDLISHLVRIRLMLPLSATDLSAADYQEFPRVVWLNIVMSVNTILLHHRPLKDGESLEGASSMATHWPHCVAAARGTVIMIAQASRASTSFAANAHITSLLFMCCRVLVVEYLCPSSASATPSPPADGPAHRDASLRKDLEVLVLAFERMREALKSVGRKFSRGVAFYLRGGEGMGVKCKTMGARDLLRTCEKWPNGAGDEEMVIPP